VPIEDSECSLGKCGFKGLRYMALEISALMYPVQVNTEVIEDDSNGFLYDSNE